MSRLAEIQRSRSSTAELLAIVGAMRSLAAMRLQEAQQALPSMRRYSEAMAQAIGTVLLLLPAAAGSVQRRGRRALILCAAEHGFVGGFNDRLIERAQTLLRSGDLLCVLGSRGTGVALERRQEVTWDGPMATRIAATPDTVAALLDELYPRIARGEIARVDLLLHRYRQGRAPELELRALLPIDPRAFRGNPRRQPPLTELAPAALLEKLVAEYVFAQLTEALAESIASENAARFAAMQAAHDNVSKKLSDLAQAEREARQGEITAELLDLVVGSGALA